jgi:hypothetical protein
MRNVAGNADPIPSGAIPSPNRIPPKQAILVHILFKSSPSDIRNCDIAIGMTNSRICVAKKSLMKSL